MRIDWSTEVAHLRRAVRADAAALHLPQDGRLGLASGDPFPESAARLAVQRGGTVELGPADSELSGSGLQSALSVPLPRGLGALSVGRSTGLPFSSADKALLDARAEVVALRIDLSEVQARLQDCERDCEELAAQRLHPADQAHHNMAGLSRMARQLGHDLRGPLANLRVALDLLRGADPQDQDRLLDRLDAEIGHASQLIADRVHLTRALEPCFGPMTLASAVRQAAMELRRPGDVKLELAVDEAPSVVADAELLTRLLVLLAENAVEALEGGGTLRLEARPVEDGAELRVEDAGPGIPPELRERVLAPGFTTHERSGGLGLTICQRIAAAHRGTLRIEDSPLGGAAVVVRLPKEQEIPVAGTNPATSCPSTP